MDNISLFEFSAVSPTQSPLAAKLDIVHMEFVHSESLSWQELFSGYDTLHAITYSSGIGFICLKSSLAVKKFFPIHSRRLWLTSLNC